MLAEVCRFSMLRIFNFLRQLILVSYEAPNIGHCTQLPTLSPILLMDVLPLFTLILFMLVLPFMLPFTSLVALAWVCKWAEAT
jgi:hypothetical protein